MQQGTLLDILVSVSRCGADSRSAAVNSPNRLFRGELPCACPWPPGDRSGQGQGRHLRTTTSSQACVHTGSRPSGCEAEGKGSGKRMAAGSRAQRGQVLTGISGYSCDFSSQFIQTESSCSQHNLRCIAIKEQLDNNLLEKQHQQ